MKKKIVIISEALGGGVRRHILDILRYINKDEYEMYFLYNLDRADSIFINELDSLKKIGINLIEIYGFNRNIGINDIRALNSIYKVLKEIKPDVVHCHSSKAGALGRVVCKLLKIRKVYYTPHAYIMQNPKISKYKKIIFSNIEKVLSRYFTTKTICVSEGERTFALENGIDIPKKFEVIYNGIEDYIYKNNSDFRKQFNIQENDFIIGTVARLSEQKDPETFIDIAEKVIKVYENAKFVYVGDGELYNDIKNKIFELNLEKNIILTGFREDIDEIMYSFDVFLSTSLYEGMPYSLIEALRSKLPIIATNVVGNNEIVENGINGYLFSCKDSNTGSSKILKLIEDNKELTNMKNSSYLLFKDKFTIDNMINSSIKNY